MLIDNGEDKIYNKYDDYIVLYFAVVIYLLVDTFE